MATQQPMAPTTQTGTVSGPPNQVFASLDVSRKGYLSRADVGSNQFLASNFQRCDVNNDGRLSQTEVSGCMQSPTSR